MRLLCIALWFLSESYSAYAHTQLHEIWVSVANCKLWLIIYLLKRNKIIEKNKPDASVKNKFVCKIYTDLCALENNTSGPASITGAENIYFINYSWWFQKVAAQALFVHYFYYGTNINTKLKINM